MNTIPQPSVKSLLIACFFSIIVAIIILLVAVLPAEFNIDPTGLGKKFGFTVLSQKENEAAKPSVVSCSDQPEWKDTVLIKLPANSELEYKFSINKDDKFEFVWNTNDGTKLYFDFHGEPKGDTTGYFKSYKVTTDSQSSGSLTAPFTGVHGWYWKNKTNKDVTINLNTRGNYKIVGLL
ncbi:MAG: hypothetical protein L3J59_05530 [Methylococcaceae bacterium]|nr:hypothetical protein [Methylococcaceae bacterium]